MDIATGVIGLAAVVAFVAAIGYLLAALGKYREASKTLDEIRDTYDEAVEFVAKVKQELAIVTADTRSVEIHNYGTPTHLVSEINRAARRRQSGGLAAS